MNAITREIIAIAIIGAALVLIVAATDGIVRHQDEDWIVTEIWLAIMLAATSFGMMTHKLKK
jgi:hypothetical protein